MDSERLVPPQGLLLRDLFQGTPTYPKRHVALAPKFVVAEVGRVVVVGATCHVGLELVAGGQDEVVNLEDLQDAVLVEKW